MTRSVIRSIIGYESWMQPAAGIAGSIILVLGPVPDGVLYRHEAHPAAGAPKGGAGR